MKPAYYKEKVNTILQSKYLIERELFNIEEYINFKLKLTSKVRLQKPKEAIVDDPLIQEILSVYQKSF